MTGSESELRTVAAEDLRACMRLFPTGVALLTAGEGDSAMGMTINSVVSVSLSPPTLLVSVHQYARIAGRLVPGAEFSVSFLSADQAGLTRQFASADRPAGEAAVVAMGGARGANGVPFPVGAVGVLECLVDRTVPVGDHNLVIGLVVRAELGLADCSPQVFHCGELTTVHSADRPIDAST
ncbi:flavin reductase family protein [Saccharopolyspora indica]|uniref:flavin reductase family protein n=1 Tax=Saccharopolyspora indica TaxID=1229659 RepID=UPI0022EAC542|nr:flavin reductase family protein [Saccharopolyspora indica]MDA3644127.1 flavin reductase family protein [Saccharopolyspora indica]